MGAKERIYYFVLNIEKAEVVFLESLEADQIIPHPRTSEKVIVLLNNEIREYNIGQKEFLEPIVENVSAIAENSNEIYYLNKEGFIFKASDLGEKEERLNIIPFEVKEETKYELLVKNNILALKENDSLYIFDYSNLSFEKLLDPAKGYKLSEDDKKLVFYNSHEIWVMFLEKQYEQPQKEAKERVFINRFSEKITNLYWYTNHYLIFALNNKIKVAEIDDRDKINIVELAEFKNPEIFFANKKLYIFSENNLYSTQEIAP
ncbi:hypothetical protein GF374_00560 [Candidatus Woesearchaeota archaeon]|nr:hypothetical protein [Candidatus Woesearchaeota archaeon]